ncbi:MAG: MFS transporter, partial [Anaerolineaceae bacterium]|nr:MFS transporter [Anaerolineaceae bacterium]
MLRSKTTPPLILTCISFLFLGMTLAAIGPILPELAQNAGTGLAAIGSIFTALFLGALIAQLAAGPITDRIGQQPVLAAGLFLLAVGLTGFTLTRSLAATLTLAFLAGLGHGAIDLSCHILLSRVFQDRNVGPLNLLNFFYGAGAFLGPAVVSLGIALTQKGLVVMWAASA